MTIILYYYSTSPPCQAVRIAARVLGVEMQIQDMDLYAKREQLTPEFLKMNPNHCVPTIADDGFYMWESRAIMAYLSDQYGKDDRLYPRDVKQRAVINNMMQFDLGSLYLNVFQCFMPMTFNNKPEDLDLKAKIVESLGVMDGIFAQRPYVAGDHLTIADISLMCSLHLAMYFGFDFSPYKHMGEWRERVKRVDLPFFDELTEEGIKGFDDYIVKKKAMLNRLRETHQNMCVEKCSCSYLKSSQRNY